MASNLLSKAIIIGGVSIILVVGGRAAVSSYHEHALDNQFKTFNLNTDKQTLQYKQKLLFEVYSRLRLYTGQGVLPLQLEKDPVVNAWTDGDHITFTTGMLKFTENEDEIANILAHEMAHEMLKHVQDEGSTVLSVTDREAHADKMGTYLLLRAGYNICTGKEIWKKLQQQGDGDYADTNEAVHPSYAYRYYAEQMPWCNK